MNIVFNEDNSSISDDTAVIHTEAQSEGEKEKIIQMPQNMPNDTEQSEDKEPADQQNQQDESEPHHSPETPNTAPALSNNEPQPESEPHNKSQATKQQYGCGQHIKHQKGHYRALNKGLVAAITANVDKMQEDDIPDPVQDDDEFVDELYSLPPDIALASHAYLDPKTLDKVLRGPDAKQWEEALKYEINQLEKLLTWAVMDLPPKQMAIPCSEVVRVKRGPDGKVQSYQVRIVAGGHRQVKGVNYTETFLAAAKMPMVWVVLANAAH